MSIALWPLIGRDSLVRAFRPGERSSNEGPFRTLRKHHWSTSGVRITPRAAGRAAGRVTVFSTLNLEAARLARLDEAQAAARVAKAAGVLESGAEFAELQQLLSSLSGEIVGAVLEGVFPAEAPTALWESLRTLAVDTKRLWAVQARRTSLPEVVAGRISSVGTSSVTLRLLDGQNLAIPRWLARAVHREEVGDCLAVVTDRLEESSALAYAIAAFDLDAPPPKFSPFGRAATTRYLTKADGRLLSGRPAPLHVLVPVAIGR
jgi:hypothetical protein